MRRQTSTTWRTLSAVSRSELKLWPSQPLICRSNSAGATQPASTVGRGRGRGRLDGGDAAAVADDVDQLGRWRNGGHGCAWQSDSRFARGEWRSSSSPSVQHAPAPHRRRPADEDRDEHRRRRPTPASSQSRRLRRRSGPAPSPAAGAAAPAPRRMRAGRLRRDRHGRQPPGPLCACASSSVLLLAGGRRRPGDAGRVPARPLGGRLRRRAAGRLRPVAGAVAVSVSSQVRYVRICGSASVVRRRLAARRRGTPAAPAPPAPASGSAGRGPWPSSS